MTESLGGLQTGETGAVESVSETTGSVVSFVYKTILILYRVKNGMRFSPVPDYINFRKYQCHLGHKLYD